MKIFISTLLIFFTVFIYAQGNVRSCGYLVRINPIYFHSNSSQLTSKSKKELYKITVLMKKYPKMVVECTSLNAYDERKKISKKRTKKVASFMLKRGVESNRILRKLNNDSKSLKTCQQNCTDEDKSRDRRTEFIIVKM